MRRHTDGMRVRVLGPLELGPPDAPVVVATRKTRQVITLLALAAPGTMSAERIATALWDEPPPAAMKTVQAHVSRARSALREATGLPEPITGSSAGYALSIAEGDVDVAHAATLRDRARAADAHGDATAAAALLGEARALWRGEPEVPSTVIGDAVRARVRDLDAALLEEHLRALVDAGRGGDALVELEPAIATEPLREGLWALRMRALYRTGRQADALRAYQDARRVLADEVGVEPGPELRHLEGAILAHDPTLDARPTDAPDAGWPVQLPRYAAVGGRHIAYATFGSGADDLLVLTPGFITIDAYLEEPGLVAALRRLASFRRVISLDRSGIGLSDPLVAEGAPTLDQWVDDTEAVLDAAGAAAVDVLANADTCLLAILLAARHPERVRSMTLLDPYARVVRSDDYPHGMSATEMETVRGAARRPDEASVDHLAIVAPSMVDDGAFRAWWDRVGRRSASPRTADRLLQVVADADVRQVLEAVTTRTLVLIRTQCPSYDAGHGRYVAAHLPHATAIERADADDLWWVGDVDALLDELERFIRGPATTP
jgi:DNA-binding SARP family transcriptional activator/pimeloyl-ACP methyl ester carboxylesterase